MKQVVIAIVEDEDGRIAMIGDSFPTCSMKIDAPAGTKVDLHEGHLKVTALTHLGIDHKGACEQIYHLFTAHAYGEGIQWETPARVLKTMHEDSFSVIKGFLAKGASAGPR